MLHTGRAGLFAMSRVVALLGRNYEGVLGLVSVSLWQPWSSGDHANDPINVLLTRKSDLLSENGVPGGFSCFVAHRSKFDRVHRLTAEGARARTTPGD